jgi:hypothetical protein
MEGHEGRIPGIAGMVAEISKIETKESMDRLLLDIRAFVVELLPQPNCRHPDDIIIRNPLS